MVWLKDKSPIAWGATLFFFLVLKGTFAAAEECPGNSASAKPSTDDQVLRCHLSAAHFGNADSIEAIVRLAGGDYINSAEGGEFLNATYMDLLIAHPRTFLTVVDQQDTAVRDRVIEELRQPVHDAYSAGDLLAAILLALRQGLNRPFMSDLEQTYAESAQRERENDQGLRDDLETAAKICLSGHASEKACSVATAKARESLTVSPHDPVVSAIAIDLADFVGAPRADEIFINASFARWACNAAAFYHHAMAQYQRYAPRSRDAFGRVCVEQASAPSAH